MALDPQRRRSLLAVDCEVSRLAHERGGRAAASPTPCPFPRFVIVLRVETPGARGCPRSSDIKTSLRSTPTPEDTGLTKKR